MKCIVPRLTVLVAVLVLVGPALGETPPAPPPPPVPAVAA